MSKLPMIDWGLAADVASRRVCPGPRVSREQIVEAVASLHQAADRAIDLVAQASGLGIAAKPPVFVLDRASWARANIQLAQTVFARLALAPELNLWRKISRRAYGAAFGAGLAMMGAKVIGQYDPFNVRLLLVVPNVLATEAKLGLVAEDFRLWAALHEQTHAVQFDAANWLVDHLLGLVGQVVLDPKTESSNLAEIVAVMSLLEGHADVMMDEAAKGHVPSWRTLREQFNHARGNSQSKLLARFGLKSKTEQYASGSAFVRFVIEAGGLLALNTVFSGAGHLPSPAELADPKLWARRVGL